MADPVVAQKAPYAVDLEPGDYYWCACGRSARQPFCDASHKGTGFKPVKLTVAKAETHYLCGCKHTATPPHCDGTHKNL